VHAGEQDLEPVVRHLDRPPANILDVQIAAAFIGLPYPLALRALVHVLVGVRLGKGMTFTQWDHRPLLPVHLGYAADDVRYLPAASKRIHEQLEALGHAAWAVEACRPLTDMSRYRFDARNICQRIRGIERLAPLDRERLVRLASVRDEAAREEDVPPRTLLQDPVLLRLVRHPARTVDDLRGVKGLPRPVAEQYGPRIIEALALKNGAEKRSARPAPPVEETALDRTSIDSLFAVASSYCRARRVDTNLVMNRSDIVQLHFRQARVAPLEDLRIMQGWRGELLGSMLRSFMAGTLQLTVGWREGDLEVEEKGKKHKAQSTKHKEEGTHQA
jgi:ribonuclease D